MTLYLKYRPQTFEDLDITSVRETLKKIISGTSIPHAFLFYGPKGTGKTSAARILAKAINCENRKGKIEPCNKCSSCISISKGNSVDVVELDAASHRGIDDIRSLREAVKLAPTSSEKKIYIIDEAHMLTTEASNALLKTLEEPPDHVIFILATTNPEKLIPTIRSRTTMISFTKAIKEEFIRSLSKVAKSENIKVDNESLEEIAKFSDGSFRDAVKTFEQLISEKIVLNPENVKQYLTGVEFDAIDFLNLISKGELAKVLSLLDQAIENGSSAKNITNLLIRHLRQDLIGVALGEKRNLNFSKNDTITLMQKLIDSLHDINVATLEQIPLELVLVDFICGKIEKFSVEDSPVGLKKSKDDFVEKQKIDFSVPEKEVETPSKKKAEKGDEKLVNNPTLEKITDEIWISMLSKIRQINASTEALLRAATPISFDGKCVTLGVYYSFHKERLEANPHRILLEDTISAMLGSSIRVTCILTSPPVKMVAENVVLNQNTNTTETQVLTPKSTDVILTEDRDDDIVKIAEKIFN